MTLRKGKVLREELSSQLYDTNKDDELILHFTDMLAFSGNKKTIEIKSKGLYTSQVAAKLFRYLESYHIDTCFLEYHKNCDLLVREFKAIPIKVTIWNIAGAAHSRDFGFAKYGELPCPIVETYYQDDKQQYKTAGIDVFSALSLLTAPQFEKIDNTARKINTVLKSFFERRQLVLADISLYFGTIQDTIVLCGGLDFDHIHIGYYDENSKQKKFKTIEYTASSESFQVIKDRIIS